MNNIDLSLRALAQSEKLDLNERFMLQPDINFNMLKQNYQNYWKVFLNTTNTLEQWLNNKHLVTPGWFLGLRDHTLYNISPVERERPIRLFKLSPVATVLRPKNKECIVKRISDNPIQYYCYNCNKQMGEDGFQEHCNNNNIKFIKLWPPMDGKQYATIKRIGK